MASSDSRLAASMKPHVFTTITSASSIDADRSAPWATNSAM
jgi:hypothetical protein